MTFAVVGFRDIQVGFAQAAGEFASGLRSDLRNVAVPVRREAESLAVQKISHVGPRWSRMRVGSTSNAVYVAPRQRGIKGRGLDLRRRPNLADLLMERAMEPALEHNAELVEREVDRILGRVVDDFNHG